MPTATKTSKTSRRTGRRTSSTRARPAGATSNGVRNTITRAAIGAAAGGAATAIGRAVVNRRRRPRLLGIRIPRELTELDVHKLAKQLGKLADQVESRTEDVRLLSRQTKRLSKKLS